MLPLNGNIGNDEIQLECIHPMAVLNVPCVLVLSIIFVAIEYK